MSSISHSSGIILVWTILFMKILVMYIDYTIFYLDMLKSDFGLEENGWNTCLY